MSIGAISLGDINGGSPSDPMFTVDVEFVGDNSYPTGGTPAFTESVRDAIETARKAATDKNVRGRTNISIICIAAADCGQYVPWFDGDNDKLFVRDGGSATWAEVSNGVSLAAVTFKLKLLCK